MPIIYVVEKLSKPIKVENIEIGGYDANSYLNLINYIGIPDFDIYQDHNIPTVIRLENCNVEVKTEYKLIWQNNILFKNDAHIYKQWLCYSNDEKLNDINDEKVEFVNEDNVDDINFIGQIIFIK